MWTLFFNDCCAVSTMHAQNACELPFSSRLSHLEVNLEMKTDCYFLLEVQSPTLKKAMDELHCVFAARKQLLEDFPSTECCYAAAAVEESSIKSPVTAVSSVFFFF